MSKHDRTKLYVYAERCDQCLFSKNKIVSERSKQSVLEYTLKRQTHFTCHKSTIDGSNIGCRGFFDELGDRIFKIRLAKEIGVVVFVDRIQAKE